MYHAYKWYIGQPQGLASIFSLVDLPGITKDTEHMYILLNNIMYNVIIQLRCCYNSNNHDFKPNLNVHVQSCIHTPVI